MAKKWRMTGTGNITNTDVYMPDEGELFLRDIGEGGKQLQTIKNGTVYNLGFEFPNDWQGKTIGQWQNQYNADYAKQLGVDLNTIPTVQSADFDAYKGAMGLKDSRVYDVNQFKGLYSSLFTGGAAETTPNPTGISSLTGQEAITQSLAQDKAAGAGVFNANYKWQDPATGQTTAAGIGMPTSNVLGSKITDIADLDAKKAQLKAMGIKESDFPKYISQPSQDTTGQGILYYKEPVKLTSPTGETKMVPIGSTEANGLLKAGWTTGGQTNYDKISSPLLTPQNDLNIGSQTNANTYGADTVYASAKSDAEAAAKAIADYMKMLTPPESDLSKQVSQLLGEIGTGAQSLTGRGAAQLSAEQQAGIAQQQQSIADTTTELNKKLAEMDALTSSYNLANQQEEGRPQTLSRLQGAQAQNYKMYIAQKNLLASEAGILQAELLGKQGKLASAQAAVDRAVELAYSDREAAYNAKLAQLSILQPQLEKEEKRYAEAMSMYLQQQSDILAEQKQAQKDALNTKLETQVITAGGRQLLVNTQTGETIKDFGGAYKTSVNGAIGGGITDVSGLSSQTQAIINNPSLFDDLTPTMKGKIISELQANNYDTTNLGVKGLSDSAISTIAQSQKALDDLANLRGIIQGNEDKLGPITGLARFNPWSEAKKLQADINRVKQTVGKALEGGVLRKEDEEKYKQILATLSDTPSTATYKIDALIGSIQRDIETYKSLQQSSGRSANVYSPLTKSGQTKLEDLRTKYGY